MAEQLLKLFSRDIQKNLFPANAFYKSSKLDGGIDVKAKNVEIPQSGSIPDVIENPTSFPLTVSQRTDDTKTYPVDLIATQPIHIEDENEIVTNYSKRQDILSDHLDTLKTRVADKIAFAWAKTGSGNVLLTTGSARPSSFGGADKKAVTYDDIVALSTAMDADDIPEDGRFLLVGAQMYADLLKINEFISLDYRKDATVPKGVVGEILGFMIYKRSRAVTYDATLEKKAPTAAGAATDKESILAWHQNFVRRAEGNVKVYSDTDNPVYLGSIFNAKVRVGGMGGRLDGKGVYSLVQDENA